MKNVSGIGTRVARGAAVLAMLAGGLGITAAEAAPIGVPAATTGAGKTTLGGEVNISSAPGKGTAVTAWIPLLSPEESGAIPIPRPIP